MVDKEGDIFQPLPERGRFDREDVEPIKQVFAEPAGRDGLG
jgi:hypothetical protein